ncbi:MAG TPA: rhomboid family intramembrane serine protease [Bacteroidales bacterium]|nr:rhomboid family intramembrane serine protease [Bacteroidales bacterium]
MNGYGRGFAGLTPVVKNIILINALMFLVYWIGTKFFNLDLNAILGLYFPKSDNFKPVQLLSHMFMHANFWHIFFNMYALFIFGVMLENVWGPKRFLIFYLVCGFGAALVHESVIAYEYSKIAHTLTPENLQLVLKEGSGYWKEGKAFTDPAMKNLQFLLNIPTVGASGAIFGVLLAFGMLFPNTQLMIIFPPIPIKAKYLVMIYGGLELVLAVVQPGDSIAHAAHVGGMIFGFILIKYWQKTTTTLY